MDNRKFSIIGKYKVRMSKIFNLDFAYFSNFYLPIIDTKAYSLYLFLFSEGQNSFSNLYFLSNQRLVDFLNLKIIDIEKGIKYLEFLNLIEVYKNKEKDEYIYVIKPPVGILSFNDNLKLKELLISKIGKENYDLNLKNYIFKIYNHNENFKLISTNYQVDLNKKAFIDKNTIKLDFLPLFNVLEETKINYKKFWNIELEEVLKDVIILYKLSLLDLLDIFKYMKKNNIVIDSKSFYDVVKQKFNFKIQNLDKIIESEKISLQNKEKMLKNTNSLDFLNLILNREVNKADLKIISTLKEKYNFSDYIINVLIDYSNIVNGGLIIANYIYSISNTLLKLKILKDEEIINYLKVAYQIKKHREKTEEISFNIKDKKNNEEVSDYLEKIESNFGWLNEWENSINKK
ncbi:MAG: hypothetical protein HPAVJP_4540 [Candidatus Hepatoplasma vulgare]|nr:MAG: hypothetical protein HPAVJP_4540 [Candidatus Hepatoplasma sp.]